MRVKTIVKRLLYFTLILAMLVPVLNLTSCDRKYDEAEVKAAATALLKESEMLNGVLFGQGIATVTGPNTNGAYHEADYLHLVSLGFTTIEELRARVNKTFTAEYAELIFSTILSPINVDGVAVANTRYYQKYADEMTKTDPVCIMVFRDYEYVFRDTVVYDYDSIRVTDVKKQTLYISVDLTVTDREDEQSQRRTLTFELIEEADGWRINSPTYMNYNAYADKYDDLKDQDIRD